LGDRAATIPGLHHFTLFSLSPPPPLSLSLSLSLFPPLRRDRSRAIFGNVAAAFGERYN
jgi:hypothetical protein